MKPTKAQREAALRAASQLEQPTKIVTLSADGKTKIALTDEERDQLLAKCAANEYVRLVVEVLAYEHTEGEPNRRFVKIRDGAVLSAARTAEGRPFLRDHAQGNQLARAGTILESRGVRRGDGEYAIEMVVELTAPWAVDLALRGLLTFVSIGMNPTGPVLCSLCGTEIFSECCHILGEEIVKKPGSKPVTCEWIFTSVEIVECSAVNVPAVPGAQIEGIRAALSAALLSGSPPQGETKRMDPELLKLLGLAATASEAEFKIAVETLNKRTATLSAELGIANKDLAVVAAEREALKQAKLAADAKAFIDEAISLGKIAPSDTETWSNLYALDSAKSIELMAKRAAGQATPVGAPRQAPVIAPEIKQESAPVIEMSGHKRDTFSWNIRKQLGESIARLAAEPKALAFAAKMGFEGRHGGVKVPTELGATSIVNNADLVIAQQGFRAALMETVVGQVDPIFEIATEVPSARTVENYKWLGDLPQMEEWKNERILSQLAAYEWSIANKKWQNGIKVKNDDFRDDNLGLLPAHVSALGEQAALQPSMLVAQLLCNGFDGNTYPTLGNGLAFDGDFFFSASHPTGSNLLSGSGAGVLSTANLGLAFTALRQQKRFDGLSLYAKPTHLIVGVDLEETAIKILSSDFLATVFGSNSAAAPETNIYKGRVKLIVSPIIPTGHWFVADLSNSVKPMLFQNREGIQVNVAGGGGGGGGSANDFVGFAYDETWFGAHSRNNAGYWDFRRIIGATGS